MTAVSFTHYQVTWKAGISPTEDAEKSIDFWLPVNTACTNTPDHGYAVKSYMADVLNLVELDADEHGYRYDIKVIETREYRMVG